MNSSVDTQINFLVENSVNPVIIFDKKSLMVVRLNPAALNIIHDVNEKSMEVLFSDEVLDAILENKYFQTSTRIFRNIADSSGEIFITQDESFTGIILIKSTSLPPAVQESENTGTQETRFSTLFDQSPLLFQIFNAKGELIKYNPSFEQTLKTKAELPGEYNILEDYSLGNDFRSHLEKAFSGEFSVIPPVKFSPAFIQENYIWMRGFVYPVKETTGKIEEVVLILENITDLKKIEESFGIESSFRNAIESSISAGIAVVDNTGRQSYVNEAFCQMVGWSKAELTGMYPPFIYWAPEYLQEIETAFSETINGTFSNGGYELKFRTKNNDLIDVLVVINSLKNETNKINGWLASVSDISKLKNAEKEMIQSLREKEILLKEIHHRVKNNLQIISSLLNLQLNYISDKQTQMIFKESQNRVMSMALIHQKLYLSKNQVNIDLQEYITELIQHLIQSFNTTKDITIDVQVENTILDHDKVVILGLILNELISNSIRHGFAGLSKGSIRVHLKQLESKYYLEVIDNGRGFPPDVHFKKSSTLGLQLVNTLVDQLGGTVKLNQEHGCAFKIEFRSRKSAD